MTYHAIAATRLDALIGAAMVYVAMRLLESALKDLIKWLMRKEESNG